MNVTELIQLTNHFTTQHSAITAKERELYLEFLNVANNEFYQIATSGLRTLVTKIDIFLDDATSTFPLPVDWLHIRAVHAGKYELTSVDIDMFNNLEDTRYVTIQNRIYCDLTKGHIPSKINPDTNVNTQYLTVFYVKNPLSLSEDGLNNTLNVPPYPATYHHYLAYGAANCFYLQTRIFLEKQPLVLAKWEVGKMELTNYVARSQ